MKEKIVKDGTKIILFALDTEDTSVTGIITGHWSTIDGRLMYECHYTEALKETSIISKEEILRLYLTDLSTSLRIQLNLTMVQNIMPQVK